jgi:DinB superfamily
MHPTLEQLQLELTHSLQGLDAVQTRLRPSSRPDKWSIQQITEHLLLTYMETATALKARLAKGTPTRRKPSLSQRIGQYAVCKTGFFPHGLKAPALVMPLPNAPPRSGDELIEAARMNFILLDHLCTEAESAFGPLRCTSHMVLGPLSADQWRRFVLVHSRHHLRHIRAIRKAHDLTN